MKIKPYIHILVMLLVFVVALSVYGGWYSFVNKESVEGQTLAGQIQAQTELTTRAQEAKDDLSKVQGDQALVQSYFVDTTDIVSFLESLQSTGQGLGSTVSVVSVSAENGNPHNYLNLSLSITGTFDSVERTLGSLEHSAHDIQLTSLTLDTTGNGKAASQWNAAATFTVGTLATPTAAKTASSTTP